MWLTWKDIIISLLCTLLIVVPLIFIIKKTTIKNPRKDNDYHYQEKKALGWLLGAFFCFLTALYTLYGCFLVSSFRYYFASDSDTIKWGLITLSIALLGFIFGTVAYSSKINLSDGQKTYRYKKYSRIAGLTGMILFAAVLLVMLFSLYFLLK